MNADGDRVAPFENLAQQCAKKLSVSRFPIPSLSGRESVGKISLCTSPCSPCLRGASFLSNFNTETQRSRSLHGEIRFSRQTWERARGEGAKRSEKSEKKVEGCSHCSLIPRPKPLPKGEGVGRRRLGLDDYRKVLATYSFNEYSLCR